MSLYREAKPPIQCSLFFTGNLITEFKTNINVWVITLLNGDKVKNMIY